MTSSNLDGRKIDCTLSILAQFNLNPMIFPTQISLSLLRLYHLFENIKNTSAIEKKKIILKQEPRKTETARGQTAPRSPIDRERSVGLMEWKIEESEALYLSADRSQKSQSKTR